MPKKLEEVYYCDFCKAKREHEDIILECMAPKYDPAATELQMRGVGPIHALMHSVVRFTDQVGPKQNKFEIHNAVMCKDCLAKMVGFSSWKDLRHGATLVKVEEDNQNRRGGPGDR